MRDLINLMEEAAKWENWNRDGDSNHQELCIGGKIIQVNIEKKKAEIDDGPFFSGFDLTGDTPDELKADAVRQGYASMKKTLEEFEQAAAEMGIKL